MFLGHKGQFNGEDVLDIVCQQPATSRFISRQLYSFFVADEVPVAQWAYTPPRDPAAIEILSEAYFDSHYDIRSMLRVLFNSDFFRSEKSWYARVKSPAEMMVGVLRLTGEFKEKPRREMFDVLQRMGFMGQQLLNPPSVEGWHQGTEWTDSGTLMERVNFAAKQMGDVKKPGIRALIDKLAPEDGEDLSPEGLVEACLDHLGALAVPDDIRSVLIDCASQGGAAEQRVSQLLQIIVATPEFQLA